MLNTSVFGGAEAKAALIKAYLALEVDADWCVGGCKGWKDTKKGRDRYAALKAINDERRAQGETQDRKSVV